ncbi:MAG: amidohydrolase family protein, partial [Vicinamibacterales bacterium]
FLDAPECRPAFEAAAWLGVPVFVHPVNPAGYTDHLRQLGHPGVLMARGTEAAAGVYALIRGGVLAALPDLTVVMPLIAGGLLFFAGIIDNDAPPDGPRPSALLRRLYIDTMGFNADAIRATIEVVGAEHVITGSDWPILPLPARGDVEATLATLDLSPAERAAILGGTTHRLLMRRTASV